MSFHGSPGWPKSADIVKADTLTVSAQAGYVDNDNEYPQDTAKLTFAKRQDLGERLLEMRLIREGEEPLRILVLRDAIEDLKLFLSA